ncbi:hypothetical protein F4677DRAFT_441020 [Hypoxylon crocopeplum]|nr:hypothetical protein F4677DRAFT_441020 [Hypoxylon crocopeplum]
MKTEAMSDLPERRYSQPGLELAPSQDPEVVPLPYPIPVANPVIVPYKGDGSEYANAPYFQDSSAYNAYNVGQGEPEKPVQGADGSRRKLYILIGVIVAIAVIVGAVVGGVVGSRGSGGDGSKGALSAPLQSASSPSSSSSSSSSSLPSPSSSAVPKVNTTAVRANTKLSITGRRIAGDGFTSRLFWQGGDNKIRTSRYTSTGGTWSTPLVFDNLDAKPGTPIAATIYLLFPQFEVFYVDSTSTFRGLNFGEDETVPKTDSIETDRPAFTVEEDTKMSAYWPYIIYQNPNSTFHREVFDSYGRGWFNDTVQGWVDTTVVPVGDKATGIAVMPVVKVYKKPYAAGIAYRDQDGRLSVFSFGGEESGIPWHTAVPDVSVPAGTSIAAFSVGRPNSNATNTYILYQDDDQKVQAVWQGNDNRWEGPQEVGDADAGTDIACLTEQTCDEPSQVSLSEQTDMMRCYYQMGGEIKEKRFSSSGWIDGGSIPME